MVQVFSTCGCSNHRNIQVHSLGPQRTASTMTKLSIYSKTSGWAFKTSDRAFKTFGRALKSSIESFRNLAACLCYKAAHASTIAISQSNFYI